MFGALQFAGIEFFVSVRQKILAKSWSPKYIANCSSRFAACKKAANRNLFSDEGELKGITSGEKSFKFKNRVEPYGGMVI